MRKFNAELARLGDPICLRDRREVLYIAGPDKTDAVCVSLSDRLYIVKSYNLAMQPLTFINNRPVYKGDIINNLQITGILYTGDLSYIDLDTGQHTAGTF